MQLPIKWRAFWSSTCYEMRFLLRRSTILATAGNLEVRPTLLYPSSRRRRRAIRPSRARGGRRLINTPFAFDPSIGGRLTPRKSQSIIATSTPEGRRRWLQRAALRNTCSAIPSIELARLRRQAELVDPITRQFLIEAGVTFGMRVLDVGCGAGDVSFIAESLVGPSGEVVGVDRSPDAIAVARERAVGLALGNVTFAQSELSSISFDQPFDAVVGRYVLCFQSHPVSILQTLVTQLKPEVNASCMSLRAISWLPHRQPMISPVAG